jgi:hypothetical protein
MFKSGGNTLNRIIDWEYDPRRIFSVDGRHRCWGYNQLTKIRPETLSRIQVFRGHMPFGLHRLVPQPVTYITLQRDPVERTVSEYFSGVNRRIHVDHNIIKNLSLEEFVRTFANNNSQTKMIAGLERSYDYLAGECNEDTLAAAKEHLRQHFSLVGITSRFEETVALAKAIFGWRVRYYADGAYLHVTPGRPRVIASHTRAMIEEYNSYDVELFRYAVSLFNEALAQRAVDVSNGLESLRQARIANVSRLFLYRGASAVLKMFTLCHSIVRCVLAVSRTTPSYTEAGDYRLGERH